MKQHLRDLLMLTAGAAASMVLLFSGLATRPDPALVLHGSLASLQGLAGFAASAAGLGIAVWWGLSLLMAVLAAVLHKAGHVAAAATAGALSPAFMKRLAAAALGLNLVSALAAPTQAADPQPAEGATPAISLRVEAPVPPGAELAEPGESPGSDADTSGSPHWKPRYPSPSAEPSAEPDSSAGAHQDPGANQDPGGPPEPIENLLVRPGRMDAVPAAGQTAVRPGDSLWKLAADQLGPAATDAEIAGHWPRWYERNRQVIGDRPDLILPGQILDVPEVPRS